MRASSFGRGIKKNYKQRTLHRQLRAEILEQRQLMAADLRIGSIPLPPPELIAAESNAGNAGANLTDLAPLADTFRLHSRPSATKTIYLDFDGFTAVGTPWKPNAPLVSPAWDLQGDGSFSDAELRRIQGVWQRVATDFTPFDVNVTTQDPGQADLVNEGGSDQRWGIRVVFTPSDEPARGAGGVAYIGSFNWGVGTGPGATDTPCYVFNMGETAAAGAASHEVGHAVGLSHDGTNANHPTEPNQAYYTGHGTGENSWGPIMGVGGYYRNVTTWDNGVYFAANNGGSTANFGDGPDDLLIMTTENGFGYVPDPEANGFATAAQLGATVDYAAGVSNVSQYGTISTQGDLDFFTFQTGSGVVNLTFDPYNIQTFVKAPDGTISSTIENVFLNGTNWSENQGANLDIQAILYDARGAAVAVSNPNGLRASFTNLNLSAGTYYVSIDGVGFGAPTVNPPTGYTDYQSIGQYLVTGTVPVALGLILPPDPVVYVEDNLPVQVVNSVTVFDGIAGDYSDSSIKVFISPAPSATDQIGFNGADEGLGLNGDNVEENGIAIAVLTQTSTSSIELQLTVDATISSIEKLVRSVTLQVTGDAPSTAPRSVAFEFTKDALTAVDSVPITVLPTNDAPLLLNAQMNSIPEDTLFSVGQSVNEIFTAQFRDPDPGDTLRGVAIVGNLTPPTEGTWQMLVGLGGQWQNIPAVSPTARLALDLNARLRFIPAADYFGTISPLVVAAIDNTYGGAFSRASGLVFLPPLMTGPTSPVGQTGTALVINVTPVNDAPRAQVTDLTFLVTQDQLLDGQIPPGSVIDIDDTALFYSAVQTNGSPLPGWLTLDPNTGAFSGTPRALDVANLQLVLTVADSGNLKVTIPVSINVINVNDPPSQLRLVGNSVRENAVGARVGQLFSFDVDGDRVFWTSSDSRFIIRENELFLNSPLDFEDPNNRSIPITLRASDSGSPQRNTILDVTIVVEDVNEFFPTLRSERLTVVDGTPAGSLLKVLQAVDGDVTQSVKYRLIDGDVSHFTVGETSGELRFSSPVNLIGNSEYRVFVESFDNGLPSFSTTAQFVISVQPRNEFPPEFEVGGELRFAENGAPGSPAGRIPVVDRDSNPLRFEIVSLAGGSLDGGSSF
jgi:Putative Ig domain